MGAATSLLNMQPYLQQATGAPPQMPAPAPVSQNPLNDHVTAFLIKNPNATHEDVSKALSISPSLAAAVTGQVKQKLASGYPSGGAASPPPPNPVAQAFTPLVPSSIPPPVPPVAQALAPAGSPQSMPPPQAQAFPASVSPPAAAQMAPGAPGTPPTFPPNASGNPVNPDAAAARGTMLEGMPGYQPGSQAPPGVEPAGANSLVPMAAPRDNRFLDGLKRFAPALATALLTSKNPQVGAGILGGLQQGQERLNAEQMQAEALKRAQGQQDTENKFKAQGLTDDEANQAWQHQHGDQQIAVDRAKVDAILQGPSNDLKTLQLLQGQPDAQSAHDAFLKAHGGEITPEQESLFHDPDDPTKWLDHNPFVKPMTAAQASHAGTQAASDYSAAKNHLINTLTSSDNSPQGLQYQRQQIADFNAAWKGKGPYLKMPGEDGTPGFGGLDATKAARIALEGATAKAIPGRLAETHRANLVREGQAGKRLDLEKINTGYAKGRLDVALGNLDLAKARQAATEAYREYQSQPKDESSKSRVGNPWGKVYDNTLDKLKAASDDLQRWRDAKDQYGLIHVKTDKDGKVTGPADDPQEKVDAINGYISAIKKMQAGPPPSKAQYRGWIGKPSGNGRAGQNANVTPTPVASRVDAAIKDVADSGQCQSGHNCESLARQTYQKFSHAYDPYWDRSKDATALSTLQNFLKVDIAKPYTPGMSIPAGSLLYSTTLNPKSGHVAATGSDGSLNDQYGKNKYSPSDFDYYVPPPYATIPSRGPAKTAKAPPSTIGRFQVTYH